MIARYATDTALRRTRGWPILAITGPRQSGKAVDRLFESGTRLQPVEIKSGATLVPDWLRGIEKWRSLAGEEALPGGLIYAGEDCDTREGIEVFPWRAIGAAAGRT